MAILEIYSGSIPSYPDYYQSGKLWTVRKVREGIDNSAIFKATGVYPPSDYATLYENSISYWNSKGYYWGNEWNPVKWYPTVSIPPSFTGASLDYRTLEIETINALKLQKVFKDLQLFDVSVFLAELPEAVSHVTKTATILVESLMLLRKGKLSAAFAKLEIKKNKRIKQRVLVNGNYKIASITANEHRKIMSKQFYTYRQQLNAKVVQRKLTKVEAKNDYFAFVSERWLELNYGWYPLMRDVDSLVALAVLGITEAELPPISKRISTKKPVTVDTENVFAVTTLQDSYHRIGYKTSFKLVNPPTVGAYALGLNSILLGAWEAIPFSFVVDWFIQIGTLIEGVTVPTGVSITGVEKTDKIVVKGTAVGIYHDGFEPNNQIYLGNTTSYNYVSFNRTLVPTLPSLTLQGIYSLSGVDRWLSNVGNMLTSVALLKTIFLTPK